MENFERPEKSNQIESLASESVQVRCPECMKLFNINTVEVTEKRPRFQCSGCNTQFWIAYPECIGSVDLVGFPMDWLNLETNDAESHNMDAKQDLTPEPTEHKTATHHFPIKEELPEAEFIESTPCPKCGVDNLLGSNECSGCGVIFKRYYELQKDSRRISASKELKNHWESVIENYEDEDTHQRFLSACRSEDNLEYASHKYGSILEAYSGDEMAGKMKDQIIALASTNWLTDNKLKTKLRKKRVSWSSVIILISFIFMVVGYLVPILRNLVGVGASVLFLTLAIKYYFLRD